MAKNAGSSNRRTVQPPGELVSQAEEPNRAQVEDRAEDLEEESSEEISDDSSEENVPPRPLPRRGIPPPLIALPSRRTQERIASLNRRLEEALLKWKSKKEELKILRSKHLSEVRILKNELKAERSIKVATSRGIKAEYDSAVMKLRDELASKKRVCGSLRTAKAKAKLAAQKESQKVIKTQSELEEKNGEIRRLRSDISMLEMKVRVSQRELVLAKKKETSKEVELQKLKIVEQEKKNEGMKEKKEVIDITNAGDIEKERLRNKFRLELYRGKHQEKQVRDAMAKEKIRREQEKKLMYTSSSMRYTAMENGGKFQLNGGGTHGIAMQNNREREMWREM